ncbi:MAG: response regulator transcription factor [Anaerolineales bacterium]|nr:response regulator transcription factor [Anaerolineales bacterium]
MKKKTIRILVADDHALAREGLYSVLSTADDMEVIGKAESGHEAMQMVTALLPDVLLLDLVMPDVRPFEVEEWARKNHPQVATLLITAHHRERFLAKAIENNSRGYLTKDQDTVAFLDAIRKAASGEFVITAEQIAAAQLWKQTVGQRWDSLTPQEREVLRQISAGASNLEIANGLSITVKTVESHVANIFRKLEVDSRGKAIAWAHTYFLDEFPE